MCTNTHLFKGNFCMSDYMVLFDCKLYSYFCLYLFIYFKTKFNCSKIRHDIKIYFANKSCFYYLITVMKLAFCLSECREICFPTAIIR